MNGYKEIPVTYMRGGTSKGAYLLKDTLPLLQDPLSSVSGHLPKCLLIYPR